MRYHTSASAGNYNERYIGGIGGGGGGGGGGGVHTYPELYTAVAVLVFIRRYEADRIFLYLQT